MNNKIIKKLVAVGLVSAAMFAQADTEVTVVEMVMWLSSGAAIACLLFVRWCSAVVGIPISPFAA